MEILVSMFCCFRKKKKTEKRRKSKDKLFYIEIQWGIVFLTEMNVRHQGWRSWTQVWLRPTDFLQNRVRVLLVLCKFPIWNLVFGLLSVLLLTQFPNNLAVWNVIVDSDVFFLVRCWLHDPGWSRWNSVLSCRDPDSVVNSSEIISCDYITWKVSSQ